MRKETYEKLVGVESRLKRLEDSIFSEKTSKVNQVVYVAVGRRACP
jgi:hypothetical protein